MGTGTRSAPRTPGYVYAGLGLAMLLIIGLVTLTARQPPPPSIAEFAPQAVQQLKQISSELESTGFAGLGDRNPSSNPQGLDVAQSQDPIDVPRVRRCVGDPPRQIEDPQSPPCVPYWAGDNGGATAKGVTENEIKVAFVPNDTTDLTRTYETLARFFNSRFEFYGRRIRLFPYGSSGATPTGMQADAVRVDQQIGAFAALSYPWRRGGEQIYYDELARRGVLSVAGRSTYATEGHMSANRPFQWTYLPGTDVAGRHLGQWICATLKDRPAEYGGEADRARIRRFGILTHRTDAGTPNTVALRETLAGCDVRVEASVEIPENLGAGNDAAVRYQSGVIAFRSAEVTSVICLCQAQPFSSFVDVATSAAYFPEWLMSSWGENDVDLAGRLMEPRQASHVFGLRFWNKRLAFQDLPCSWAAKEADPTFQWPRRAQGSESGYDVCHWIYPAFLLLASGIQMAGPHLTPESFEAGLSRSRFPNPNAGTAPFWQGRVGFGPSDHVMNDDVSVVWWNPREPSYEEEGNPPGTYCYLDSGRRFGLGQHPVGRQALFDTSRPCR